jgi:3-keto-L-gulonate-6-phosphate decarboxylase
MMQGSKHTFNCQIDEHGTLRVNMEEIRQLTKKNPNRKVVMTLEILDGGDIEIMKSWYANHVTPRVVEAYRELGENYTAKQVDIELVRHTTIRKKQAMGEEWIVDIADLDRTQLRLWLEEVNVFCAMNLSLIL